jgi:ParB family chromosome partitioning protein
MQRSDLTVLEQAQGFQMMLDLGETISGIVKLSGFSETTIRKRLFVASLDTKKASSAYERGASIEDYLKLQKVACEEKRNKVLDTIGTHNFNHALKTAIEEEQRDRVSPEIVKLVETFAKPTDKQSWELKGYVYHARIDYEEFEKTGKLGFKIPKKFKPNEYYYHVQLRSVNIYKQQENFKAEAKMSELPPEAQEKRREFRRKYKALKEAGDTVYRLRLDFIKAFSQRTQLKPEQLEALSLFAFDCLLLGYMHGYEHYAKTADIEVTDSRMGYYQHREIMQKANAPAAKILLISLYTMLGDNPENTYFHGNESSAEKRGKHKPNAKLSAIYDCICALGYKMSDEEKALQDGTHALYTGEEDDE